MTIQLLVALACLVAPVRAEPTLRERARAQDPESLSALRDATRSEDAAERAEAAFGLGQYGFVEVPDGSTEPLKSTLTRAAAVEALAPLASDASPAVRRAAVEALGKVGAADDESFVLAAGTDADAGVRGESALALFRRRLLKRVPEYSTAAVNRLVALAADPEAEVRWRAAYAFSRWPEPRAAAAIATLQGDADARARLFAVRAAAKLKAVPTSAALSDPDPFVRAEAVTALSAAKAWDKLPDSVFADPSAHVRAAAADAAAASGDAARFGPLVEKLLAESGTLVPGRALLALVRLKGDGAALAVERARKDPRWWLRARAYEAAAGLPESADVLRQGVDDPDARVSSQALETLAASTAPNAGAVIESVLMDPKAPLENLGTAVEAAGERAGAETINGLLAAMPRAKGPGASELREDIRKALSAAAAKNPSRAAEIAAALKKFPPFTDKPRRFRPLQGAPPSVLFETERGSFTIALAGADDAGVHVAAFVESVKKGFYDGLIWHRVVTAFVVQGGDPRGSGWGDAGWRLADEINRLPFERGTVGMPKAGKDTGGCQLFVSLVPTPHLDGRYTAFGKVTEGLEVLDRLEPGDRILRARLR